MAVTDHHGPEHQFRTRGGRHQVTISGTGLANATRVSWQEFGGVPATIVSQSATSIVIDTPPDSLGTFDVRVVTPVGTTPVTSADRFTYVNGTTPAPVITSITPSVLPYLGITLVTITGTNLDNASAVTITPVGGNEQASQGEQNTIVSDTGTQIQFFTSAGNSQNPATTAFDVQVTTPNGISAPTAADQVHYSGTPAAVAFLTGAQSMLTNQSSGTVLLQLQDGQGIPALAGAGGVTIQLTSSSAGGAFYDLSGNPITSVVIPAGSTSAAFTYRDAIAGMPTISASPAGLASIQQKETVALSASLLVTNTNDSGIGSLRQAILGADAAPGSVIGFAPGVTGVINLLTALPNLSASMTIVGPGANLLTIQRKAGDAFNFGIFDVTIRDDRHDY